MDIRDLEYFLAVANEGNISRAAKRIYISQPSLTRQIQGLESEIGQPLFTRTNRKMVLTNMGKLLKQHAEEIISLYNKTKDELFMSDVVKGEVSIAGGESYAVSHLANICKELQDEHQSLKFNLYSASTEDVMDKLDRGLYDFGVVVEPTDLSKYEYIRLPIHDIWGLIVPKDDPIAKLERINPKELVGKPLIISRHAEGESLLKTWFGGDIDKIDIVATYNLLYNASLLVEAGLGYAISLSGLIYTGPGSKLAFIPFGDNYISYVDVVWKKDQILSPAAKAFLSKLQEKDGQEE